MIISWLYFISVGKPTGIDVIRLNNNVLKLWIKSVKYKAGSEISEGS